MAGDHVHSRRALRAGAGTTGDQPFRSQERGHGGGYGEHAMFAMLACCIAIGAAFLLLALGLV